MIKLMLLISRKPGLSHAEFRRYYEEHHAPLATPRVPNLVAYRRNYVTGSFGAETECDCVTEFLIDVDAPWAEYRTQFMPAEMAEMFAADEERFIDRAQTRILVVEEESSPTELMRGRVARA